MVTGSSGKGSGDLARGVTCRWHARLDVSGVRVVANSSEVAVLCSDSEPLLAESFGEQMGFRYDVRWFRDDGTGEYPG
jgi:hypothetical protein